MTRSVLFDTETTGLDPLTGDRVIEIAALELVRELPDEVVRIHGITTSMLVGKPEFAEIAPELLAFLGDGPLIAHNAAFDFGFLDAEFDRIRVHRLDRARMVDTLALAKARFPGMPNNLDALCRRFGIDLSERTSHNALLDCRLLAEVYVELTGGRQRGLSLADEEDARLPNLGYERPAHRAALRITPSEAALAAHTAFLARVKNPIWLAES
jgi:DNA polymerase-3 subunit epsilon